MSPGAITTATRGGHIGFARQPSTSFARAGGSPQQRQILQSHTRDFGQRQKFAVDYADNSDPVVTLDPGEQLIVSNDGEGNTVFTITGSPTAEASYRASRAASLLQSVSRAAMRTVSKMSWERDPATGGVLFLPDDAEVLDVSGDANQAVVVAVPAPPPGTPG